MSLSFATDSLKSALKKLSKGAGGEIRSGPIFLWKFFLFTQQKFTYVFLVSTLNSRVKLSFIKSKPLVIKHLIVSFV